MNCIPFKAIDTFLVEVSEPILSTSLHEFIFFKLDENAINIEASSRVFVSYLPECQKYFIAHFHATHDDFYIEPQTLKAYFTPTIDGKNRTFLFILEHFFALYSNEELLFFKEIKQKVSCLEITNFIEKTLHITIDNCIELSKHELILLQEEFKNNFENLKKLRLLKNNQYKEIKKFVGVMFCAFLLILGAFLYEQRYVVSLKTEPKEVITYPKKELLSYKLALVMAQINRHTLTLISMDLNNEWLVLSLQHSDKMKLIEFLTVYKCEVKTLQYNEKENLYELSATFKLI
ncbi:MAG: hypothetical protein WC149_11625 [Arcobacteraceae bacterium]